MAEGWLIVRERSVAEDAESAGIRVICSSLTDVIFPGMSYCRINPPVSFVETCLASGYVTCCPLLNWMLLAVPVHCMVISVDWAEAEIHPKRKTVKSKIIDFKNVMYGLFLFHLGH